MAKQKMVVTVLGSGTSTGVPLIHCRCSVCRSRNPKNQRLRASIWLQVGGKSIVIDLSPDFRQQAIQNRIPRIDAILFTHPHADHVGGIDEVRSYNYVQKEIIPAFAHDWTFQELPRRFPYIFQPMKIEGGGVSRIQLHQFSLNQQQFDVSGISVVPIELDHGSMKVAGFRIGNFAYLTDCHSIPSESMKRLVGLEVLILDCIRKAPHDTHLHYTAAVEYSQKIGAKKTFFTHLGHEFDYIRDSKKLPPGLRFAYDGLKINLSKE